REPSWSLVPLAKWGFRSVGACHHSTLSGPPMPRRVGVNAGLVCARATPAAASSWAATGAVRPAPSISRVNCRRLRVPALTRSIQPCSSCSPMSRTSVAREVGTDSPAAAPDEKRWRGAILARGPPGGQGRASRAVLGPAAGRRPGRPATRGAGSGARERRLPGLPECELVDLVEPVRHGLQEEVAVPAAQRVLQEAAGVHDVPALVREQSGENPVQPGPVLVRAVGADHGGQEE